MFGFPSFFGSRDLYVGGLLGARLPIARSASASILLEAGRHETTGIGREFIVETEGRDSASLSYVGARLSADFFLTASRMLVLGPCLMVRGDLKHRKVTVTQRELFSPAEEKVYRVGGISVVLGFRIGLGTGPGR